MNALAEFDLVVVGGGSAGLAGAFAAAGHGARVALLEPGAFGGTCVNVGCVPKKAMWLAAELARSVDLAARVGFGLPQQAPALDWREFVVHRQRYIAGIHDSYRRRLDAAGIVHLPQRGRLVPGGVRLDDGVVLQAPHVLLATGGRPQRPDIPGAGLGIDSDGFFNLCSAPARVALVGGGYIAVEMAGVLQALGSQVELLVRGPRLLQGFDAELTAQLAANLAQAGVNLHFDAPVQALEEAGDGRVQVRTGGQVAPVDTVIFATGRVPNTEDLGMQALGVALDGQGHVVVDAFQDTSVAGVHAVGDVTAHAHLTPVAIAAARRLMARLFGGQADARLDYEDIPTVVFAHPPLASVGLSEEQAVERHGVAGVKVLRAGFRPMLQALADTPYRSLFKLVCAGPQQRVVGIHLLGEGADEILQGFAVALKCGATLEDFHRTVAIHPTSAEELVLMR